MPHFTIQISPNGALLNALIGVSQERENALKTANQDVPIFMPVRALIDTGASATCVDPSVLQNLRLTPTGNTTVNTPSTGNQPVSVDQYDVSLVVPPAGRNEIPLVISNLTSDLCRIA